MPSAVMVIDGGPWIVASCHPGPKDGRHCNGIAAGIRRAGADALVKAADALESVAAKCHVRALNAARLDMAARRISLWLCVFAYRDLEVVQVEQQDSPADDTDRRIVKARFHRSDVIHSDVAVVIRERDNVARAGPPSRIVAGTEPAAWLRQCLDGDVPVPAGQCGEKCRRGIARPVVDDNQFKGTILVRGKDSIDAPPQLSDAVSRANDQGQLCHNREYG
jgi:hypothetical protein